MIYSVLNQKGGVGKTTLAIHIATALTQASGKRTLLIDADSQGSALTWADCREREPLVSVIGKPSEKLHREIEDIAEGYEYVDIDGIPRTASITRSAIAASDVVVIPVQPSGMDIWSTREESCVRAPLMALRIRVCSSWGPSNVSSIWSSPRWNRNMGPIAIPGEAASPLSRLAFEPSDGARGVLTATGAGSAGFGFSWAMSSCSPSPLAMSSRRAVAASTSSGPSVVILIWLPLTE